MAKDSTSRDRGILTEADREFLSLSEDERKEQYTAPSRSQRRKAIRERIENALLDFPQLARQVDDDVLEDVFGPDRGAIDIDGETAVGSTISDGQVRGVPFGLMFLLRIAIADGWREANPMFGVEAAIRPFIDDVEAAVELWLNYHHGLTADVSVNLTVDDLQRADELADELEARDEPLTGIERIEATSELSRAGYSTDEILDLVGRGE